MRTCYLHVGPTKTGSSTIQRFLHNNRGPLADAGFHFPERDPDRPKGIHQHLTIEYSGDPAPDRPTLAEELRHKNFPPNLILSSEHYAHRLLDTDFREWVQRYFALLGYRLKVLFYIRPQVALINSQYCQQAQVLRNAWTFEKSLKWWLSLPAAQNNSLGRATLVDDRRMDIEFIPFNRKTLELGLCQDFVRRLGVPDSVVADCNPVESANPSPGPKVIAAIRAIHHLAEVALDKAPDKLVKALSTELRTMMAGKGWNTGKFDGLYPKDKRDLIEAYAPSNEIFARRVWDKSWAEVFAAEENAICTMPRNVFEPAKAELLERKEFEDFCRESADFVSDFLIPA